MTRLSPALAAAALLAAPAVASAQFTVTFTDAMSAAGFGDPGNSVFTYDYTGPDFDIGFIDVTGTVVNQGDPAADFDFNFLSDGVIDITRSDRDPAVDFAVVSGSDAQNVASDTFSTFGQDSGALEGTSAVGSYRFEFFEALGFDEVAGTDNLFTTITITVNEFFPAEPPTAPLAFLDDDGSITTNLDAGEVLFYEFDYDGSRDFLLSTLGTDLTPFNDTEMALYNAEGDVVMLDDDSGTFLSALVVNEGDIDAGTYYLAVGGYDTVFDDRFSATSDSEDSGPLTITGLSVIPEPTSLALLGLGGLGLLRRKRNS